MYVYPCVHIIQTAMSMSTLASRHTQTNRNKDIHNIRLFAVVYFQKFESITPIYVSPFHARHGSGLVGGR